MTNATATATPIDNRSAGSILFSILGTSCSIAGSMIGTAISIAGKVLLFPLLMVLPWEFTFLYKAVRRRRENEQLRYRVAYLEQQLRSRPRQQG